MSAPSGAVGRAHSRAAPAHPPCGRCRRRSSGSPRCGSRAGASGRGLRVSVMPGKHSARPGRGGRPGWRQMRRHGARVKRREARTGCPAVSADRANRHAVSSVCGAGSAGRVKPRIGGGAGASGAAGRFCRSVRGAVGDHPATPPAASALRSGSRAGSSGGCSSTVARTPRLPGQPPEMAGRSPCRHTRRTAAGRAGRPAARPAGHRPPTPAAPARRRSGDRRGRRAERQHPRAVVAWCPRGTGSGCRPAASRARIASRSPPGARRGCG